MHYRPFIIVFSLASLALVLAINSPASASSAGDQLRLSTMGGIGDSAFGGYNAAVAFNNLEGEFLVVWEGTDNQDGHVSNESEIFGRRLDGATGQPLGPQFKITNFGPVGDPDFDTRHPEIVFNEDLNQYFLVFLGDWNGEVEVYSLRLDTNGQPLSSPNALSDMGPAGSTVYRARDPAVAYNPDAAEYLVVWTGDDDRNGHVDEEIETYAQRIIAASGAATGTNDILVSDMGPVGDPLYDASGPRVVYDPINGRYLVVWAGSHDEDGQVAGELEIFIQFLSGSTAQPLLADQVRISTTGGLGDPDLDASNPIVAFRPGEFLVVWRGETVNGVYDLIGQRISAEFGIEVGIDDSLLAEGHFSDTVGLAYDPSQGRYVTSVANILDIPEGQDDEIAILPVSLLAEPIGRPVQVSFMGAADPAGSEAIYTTLALNPQTGESLIVWEGYQDGGGLDPFEYEIYSRFNAEAVFCDGFESGNANAWTQMVP